MENVMKKGNKNTVAVLMLGLTTILSGCDDNSSELDEKLTYQANISFVNTLSYMTDFYLDKRSISTGYSGLFDGDHAVSKDVPVNEVTSTYNYSYKVTNNMVNLGVKDSINDNKELRTTATLNNDDNLWVIAWDTSDESLLSVVSKKQNNNADVINVRIFGNGDYDVLVENNKLMTSEKGKVTSYLQINNCADDLSIAGKILDLCTGTFGKSYLLVVDGSREFIMAEE